MMPVPPQHRPPRPRRLRAAVTTLLCLLVLVGTATSAAAAPGRGVDYRDPTDGQDRTCTHVRANNSTHAVRDSASSGPSTVGSVFYSATGQGEPDLSITIDGQYAAETEAVSIRYAAPPLNADWQLQERITSGGNTGYQYRRYRNVETGRFLYHLQMTPSGSTTPEISSYYSGNITPHQRERIIGFHDHVVDMRSQHDQMAVGGAAATALLALGVGALYQEGASFSATAMACTGAVVTGGAGIAAVWIRFLQARKKASAAFYEARTP